MLTSPAEIIDALGGTKKVAEMLGVGASATPHGTRLRPGARCGAPEVSLGPQPTVAACASACAAATDCTFFVSGAAAYGAATHGRHVCVVAHSRFNKLLIGGLSGHVSQAAKVPQGNACVNVIDFPVGGGTCNVVRLNVCDHLLSHSQTRVASGGEGGSAKSDSEKWF